ncbi:hypothetical protein ABZV31_33750 [Streptomyces sp. NPDC005202]|uniref:hypothetical protein n=1 Tax=Streptomyces sp. NPDC005202 TaxID=3157021 RepID=UPI0033AC54EA
MSASPAVRGLRAAVFAAVCVLLAAAGHGLAMGDMPPLWADGAGFIGVFVTGWLLGGRERSLPGIGAAMLATQAGLHLAFHAARPRTGTPGMQTMPSMPSMASMSAHGMPMTSAHAMASMHAHAMVAPHGHATAALTHPHALTPYAVAAHVLAALVASWWLRRGEAALWSLLRWAVAFVPGLAAWWRAAPAPLPAPAGRRHRASAESPTLRQLLLRHAVSRRGPPARIPYPI